MLSPVREVGAGSSLPGQGQDTGGKSNGEPAASRDYTTPEGSTRENGGIFHLVANTVISHFQVLIADIGLANYCTT